MDEGAEGSSGSGKRVDLPQIIVAIPVCNERDSITACLDALVNQIGLDLGTFGIVLFLNNCNDGTAEIVQDYVSTPWPIRVVEQNDPKASAGWARRWAMEAASDWIAESGHSDGILLTTDADSRVGPDWVTRNLAELAAGADAVAGRIALDQADTERLPDHLHARGRLESEYEMLLTEIDARLDPQPGNSWPCHWSKSGATIAVRWSIYKAIGGMPDMPSGEDRAFIDAICAHGFVVRHAPDIEVTTSGRLEGRAVAGVADTLKLRCSSPEAPCDVRLERLGRIIARALIHRCVRSLYAKQLLASSGIWRALRISGETARSLSVLPSAGAVLEAVKQASPLLDYRPIRPSELPRQIRNARIVLRILRGLMPHVGMVGALTRECTVATVVETTSTLSAIAMAENDVPLI